jgi:hypothetical protein
MKASDYTARCFSSGLETIHPESKTGRLPGKGVTQLSIAQIECNKNSLNAALSENSGDLSNYGHSETCLDTYLLARQARCGNHILISYGH